MGMGFSISAADNVVTITAGGDARAQFTTDIGTGITFPEEQWLKLAFKRNEYSEGSSDRASNLQDTGSGYTEVAYHTGTGAPTIAGWTSDSWSSKNHQL